MAPLPDAAPGKSYATDLRLIREGRGLSVEDVFRSTKIPVEIVTLFESTGLLNHPRFNKVYLRSFVREYARVVGVSSADAMDALEASFQGRYRGSLAVKYLGMEPPEPRPPQAAPASPRPGSEPAASPYQAQQQRRASPLARPPVPPPAPSSQHQSPLDAPLKTDPTFWERMPISVADLARGVDRLRARWNVLPRTWQIAGPLILLMFIFGFWLILLREEPPAEPIQEPAPIDSVAAGLIPATPPPPEPRLGDTMQVALVAARGVLEPIRYRADAAPLRPVWVEQGDSLRFGAVDSFTLVGQLNRLDVRVDGHPLPTDRAVDQRQLVWTRADILAFLSE